MTWRGTGLLVLTVLVVGLYAWWSTPSDPAARRTAATHALLDRDVEVTRVLLEAGPRALRLERDEDGWSAGRDDGIDVESLLTALRTVEPLMVVGTAPGDLARFGLDAPMARLELWTDAERVLSLDLGDRNPSWTALYARRDGRSDIELVGAVLYWEIEKLLARITPPGEA